MAPDECNFVEYRELQDATLEEMQAEKEECDSLIARLKQRQFGPPTEYEFFNIMCKGPCIEQYFHVTALRDFPNCPCGEETGLPCYSLPTDTLCKLHQVCHDPAEYHRYWCRGCGWEATSELQWHEERVVNPCGGARTSGSPLTVAILAVIAATVVSVAARPR